MDRKMLLEHLAIAERNVAQGERQLEHQRGLIEELRRDGHDTHKAEELLLTFEESQALHIADLDRIRAELAQSG